LFEVEAHLKLTYMGEAKVLAAAAAQTKEIGAAQCIAFADGGGHLLAFGRLDGAKVLSADTAIAGANGGIESRPDGRPRAGAQAAPRIGDPGQADQPPWRDASGGPGSPGRAIGVGSGTAEQDGEVARAGIAGLSEAKAGLVAQK
jgi:uncharacterized protein GlcG (DUF336 family)